MGITGAEAQEILLDPKRSCSGAHRCQEPTPGLDRWPLSGAAPGRTLAPQPAASAPKRGCTDSSSLLRTKFQGAQTLVRAPAHRRPRHSTEPGLRGPGSTCPLKKLASLSLRGHRQWANEPCASGCPGGAGSSSVDHQTVSVSRGSCTDF